MTDFDLNLLNKFVLHCSIHSDKLISEFQKCISTNFCVNSSSPIFLVELELSARDLTLTAYPKDGANMEMYSINIFESCNFGTFKSNEKFIRENLTLLEEIFSKWIANCWQKAGGLLYHKPVYIISKDSTRNTELITNKAVFKPTTF